MVSKFKEPDLELNRLAKQVFDLLINFNVPLLKDGVRRIINS